MQYRIRDFTLALLALFLFSPVLIGIVLLLWATQEKVWFFQLRPGKGERPFTLWKFSTMRDAAPGEAEEAHQQARLTKVGRWLRQTSLDELPQLWNVLRGEMSLVGPRPLLMEYLPLYSEEERNRHAVLPGITGWAQIHGRNQLSFKERFAYDLWYVEHRSFWLDLRILWLTGKKVWQKEGVYANVHTTSPKFDGTN
ncbi:MAG: sugar transferase [Bacteroidota bacterium]